MVTGYSVIGGYCWFYSVIEGYRWLLSSIIVVSEG